MTAFTYTYSFLIGLIMGSFFNVVGFRVPKKLSIVRPGSHCTHCGRNLKPSELIPVLSYLTQQGKCKGCQQRISPIYPLIELTTAVLFLLSPLLLGLSWEVSVAWLLISLLVIITVTDLAYMLIPDKILLVFGIPLAILRIFFLPIGAWWEPLLGAAVGFALLLLIAIVSKGGMGGGDIKLFAVLGLVFGWKGILLVFFFSTLIGTIIGLVGILSGKVRTGKPMPFGPAIALGTISAYFFGDQLLHWYTATFIF
ncbi:prepilin peptidase [Paenibacillus albus]|uniref:Prepilin leader peptidase/N-methyltransferase n=1 Tax=Paenibacillus albus TaxID=2495582 RepID=A0A3S9AC80_9BACL|nr:A24 family peptidase [Paenibacillus albus]AZN43339.1 prepilin peptidase [Paenibacillus albus]